MIAIGGSIGTGLFLTMGSTIREAGPGGAMVAYGIMGIVVYFTDDCTGRNGYQTSDSRSFHFLMLTDSVDQAWGFHQRLGFTGSVHR